MGCSIALALMILPATGHAWSVDILSHFTPYITLEEEYSSNIDLAPDRLKRDDFITTISPGLRFSTSPRSPVTGEFRRAPVAEEKFGMDLDVRAGFVFYDKERDNNYIRLDGRLNALYSLTQNLTFRVRDSLIRSDEIREPDYASTAIEGQYLLSRTSRRVPYFRNVFEPSVDYRFGRENIIAILYRNNFYEIQSRVLEDSTEHYINPNLIYWFDIRNGVSFEYGLTLGNFERSPDLVGHRATGRYTYRFNPQTSIFGEYAYLGRDFDPPFIDYTVQNPSLGIDHNFSPTLSLKAKLGYYWANFSRGPRTTYPSYGILLTQIARKTTYTLLFQGGFLEDYFSAENRGFTKQHRAIGRISHEFIQNMKVGIHGSYEWNKSLRSLTEGGELDRVRTVGGSTSYQLFTWLSLALDISYRDNRSNISDRDYSEYRGMFRVTARY